MAVDTTTAKKPRKQRAKPEGVLVKFLIPTAEYNKLQTEAEKDYRTPENLAFAATMRHAASLGTK